MERQIIHIICSKNLEFAFGKAQEILRKLYDNLPFHCVIILRNLKRDQLFTQFAREIMLHN